MVPFALAMAASGVQAGETLQPFVLASISTGELDAKVGETRNALGGAGFDVVGEFSPYDNATVIVATSDELKKAASGSDHGGYGAVVRVGVTKVGDQVQVAYVNPVYVQHAYRMDADLSGVADKLSGALGAEKTYGSEDGLTPKALRKYHYMIGMEYFDDPYELGSFDSHAAAVESLEKGLAEKRGGVSKVYRIDLSEDVTVFGVAMSEADGDKFRSDSYQMGIVDFEDLKKTAYLPYEVLVKGNDVEALNMRFRMAVHFPDLSMMGDNSFMKVKASPPAVGKALKAAAGS